MNQCIHLQKLSPWVCAWQNSLLHSKNDGVCSYSLYSILFDKLQKLTISFIQAMWRRSFVQHLICWSIDIVIQCTFTVSLVMFLCIGKTDDDFYYIFLPFRLSLTVTLFLGSAQILVASDQAARVTFLFRFFFSSDRLFYLAWSLALIIYCVTSWSLVSVGWSGLLSEGQSGWYNQS